MEAVIDKFGRIVIPKKIRDHLGLTPGTHLEVREVDDAVIVRPADVAPSVRDEDGIIVYTGARRGDIEGAVDRLRQERLSRGMD
jgi:AbrB family looped-hinge helix DNA binding protein